MKTKQFLLTANQGYRTTLDKAYNKHINSVLTTLDEEQEIRWETYNLIMNELIAQGDKTCVKEVKYRLSDGEDPNSVLLDIINRNTDNVNSLVWFLKRRLEEYLEDDNFNRFFI
jgi:hypothetical protein